MCTRYPIINRVSELKVHIELTRFVQPEKIEIDANERAVNEKSQYCFFVCTTFDSFLNDLSCYKIFSFFHPFSFYFPHGCLGAKMWMYFIFKRAADIKNIFPAFLLFLFRIYR